MDLEKKLMIPESEILKCPDTKSNQNICKRKNIWRILCQNLWNWSIFLRALQRTNKSW